MQGLALEGKPLLFYVIVSQRMKGLFFCSPISILPALHSFPKVIRWISSDLFSPWQF
jgi:hypothetical protein